MFNVANLQPTKTHRSKFVIIGLVDLTLLKISTIAWIVRPKWFEYKLTASPIQWLHMRQKHK